MFRGNHPTRVDDKGRLKIPADFKRLIDEKYGTQFYVTSTDGRGADVYPLQEWEKFEEKLALIPNFNPTKKKLLGIVSYYGQVSEMDAQGRVLIPQILREKANVMGDMVVLGMQNHLRVVNREAYERELGDLTPTDEKELAELGL
jgi:MraZ protein